VEPSFSVPSSFRPVFTAGGTVSRGISTLVQNVVPFLGLTLLSIVPLIAAYALLYAVVGAAEVQRIATIGFTANPGWFWPIYLGAMVACFGPAAAIMHASAQHMAGGTYRLGESLAHGYRRAAPMFLVYILFAIAIIIGFIALIVPGLILLCMLFMVLPVTVLERRGIFGGFRRAIALSKGYRTTLFAIGLAQVGISFAVGLGVWLVSMGMILSVGALAGPAVAIILLAPIVIVAYLGLGALGPVLVTAAYVGLREEKEIGTADQVAGVFS
jgi:hypothetical protein